MNMVSQITKMHAKLQINSTIERIVTLHVWKTKSPPAPDISVVSAPMKNHPFLNFSICSKIFRFSLFLRKSQVFSSRILPKSASAVTDFAPIKASELNLVRYLTGKKIFDSKKIDSKLNSILNKEGLNLYLWFDSKLDSLNKE